MRIIDNQPLLYSYLEKNNLHVFFSPLDINKIRLCSFSKGESIIAAGEPLQEILFIVEGKVKVFTMTPEDKRLIIRFLKAPVTLGDIEFANEEVAVNSVEASTDCMALSISYKDVKETIGNDPSFLQFLLKSIAHKFRTKTNFTTFNVLYPVEVRFASYLLSISTNSKGTLFREEMKNSSIADIADLIGTSYRHLNRVILKLCEEQVIERVNGTIHIKNFEKLRELAKDNIYE
ncbi:Crp/Fnr family transcriptional regulator [Bacillus massiliigorillae]|uniref:Crp/Fnr family transcriptional regulator n=1 Tax=Bacillus massiliigorillae TaxID=1243664 RepID=UPI00039A9691|nr:cyclic nucleotide-binding domain-containing protein [Bacillus massiliigorillae]